MPVIKPETQAILRAAGLEKESAAPEGSVSEKLDIAGLDLSTISEELCHLAKNSGNDSLRLRALETALKAHGALKETAAPPASFTLIIQPSGFSTNQQSVNLPNGINPILLPRPLLNQLGIENSKKDMPGRAAD